MKTFLYRIFLTVLMALSVITAAAYDFEIDSMHFTILENVGYADGQKGVQLESLSTEYEGKLEIPQTVSYNGESYEVRQLKGGCFSQCGKLTNVSFPSSITELPRFCFHDSGLISLTVPTTIKSIGADCFKDCHMEYIYVPSSVTNLEASLCGIKKVEIDMARIPSFTLGYYDCEEAEDATVIFGPNVKEIVLSEPRHYNHYRLFEKYSPAEVVFSDSPEPIKWLKPAGWDSYKNKEIYEECENSVDIIGVQILYLGREVFLLCKFYEDCLETIKIGPNIENLSYLGGKLEERDKGLSQFANLRKIESLRMTPPKIEGVSDSQYRNLEVIVPEEALDVYRSDPVWGPFWNLIGGAAVETVVSENAKTIIGQTDMTGLPIGDDYKGLKIIRFSDGTSKKVIQR